MLVAKMLSHVLQEQEDELNLDSLALLSEQLWRSSPHAALDSTLEHSVVLLVRSFGLRRKAFSVLLLLKLMTTSLL